MLISKYLDNIKFGKPINFDSFCKELHRQGYDKQTILSIFSTQKTSKSKYQVDILDENAFAMLQERFPAFTIHNRVSATVSGNSHKHPVSQAMVIIWAHQHNHPVVVLNDGLRINSPVTLGQRLLIIENQENFVQKDQTLAFLKSQFPHFNDEMLDIAHASGNAISNRLNKLFFEHYQQIDCLLDLDIGGLTIFANVYQLTQHPHLNFLLPPCAAELLEQSRIDLQEKHLAELRKLREAYPLLNPAIELMVNHKKMLEQEMYLQD